MRSFIAALLAVPAIASAANGTLVGSKHDLSTTGGASVKATTESQSCKFCHAPHQASTQAALWNHTQSGITGFPSGTTIGGTTLPTTINQASRACLGCHDGVVALGSLTQGGGTTITGLENPIGVSFRANLNGDHPVSVPMPGSTYNGITTPITGVFANYDTTPAGVKLYGAATFQGIECGTCHDVHNNSETTNTYFLRVAAASSAICTSCHIK